MKLKTIGLGTAAIGRPQYINIRNTANSNQDLASFKAKGIEVLETAYKNGIRYFDTAPGYGMAESLISQWLQDKQYKDVETATKWGYRYVANFNPNAKIHEVKEHTLSVLNQQWHKSKELLPNVSTLQIHSATFDTGVLDNREILERLYELKQKHHLKIGLSSTGNNQVELLKYALDIEVEAQQLFDAFQVTYNILDQSLATIIHEFKGKRLIIKEALANGRLIANNSYPQYQKLYALIKDLAQTYHTTEDVIALRFCADSIQPYIVLSGASNQQHLLQNIKAEHIELSQEDIDKLQYFALTPQIYWDERKKLVWN